ncbi:MAG: hypothetical protein A2074_04975 [Candidatus Aquicultor primus]|uniref:Uncharacterized protein n=1 Tax=Candidatus Aquicultor primus TaxID=1797195 RepID=A0A1F2UQZ7_9ACTN|nr:MAG: hypothetical protein A2074_04975 [Candidatus Aquicultor primus]HCG98345.1 hypothetical protein [Actinomycetota bacterium]
MPERTAIEKKAKMGRVKLDFGSSKYPLRTDRASHVVAMAIAVSLRKVSLGSPKTGDAKGFASNG